VRFHLVHFPIVLAALMAGDGCKGCKKEPPTCNPDDEAFETIHVVVQASENLNPDAEGNPLSVQLRIYQLAGDQTLEMIDFEQVWHEGGEVAFGDDYLAEEVATIHPGRPDHLEIKPEADARFVVATAIFNEPIGQDWFRVWEVPKYHGHSVCNAKKKKKPWPDPCFHVLLDRFAIDGGHTPPSGWDAEAMGELQCPGAPMTTPPPDIPEDDGKKKKKKKGKKVDLEDAKKAQEGADKAQGVEAPEAPGG
jgi:type VI secretion system VasD/TssJ family lipoprotein